MTQGDYKDDPEFKKSYKIAHAKWLSQDPSERKVFLNTGNKYEYVSRDKVTSMYKAGNEHAAQGKLLFSATKQQQRDQEFIKGCNVIRDNIDMGTEAGAATGGVAKTRSRGTGTPTLANKLPSPQRGAVADLTGVFEAYARGLGQTP